MKPNARIPFAGLLAAVAWLPAIHGLAESGTLGKPASWAEAMLAARRACVEAERQAPPAGAAQRTPFDSGTVLGEGAARQVSLDVRGCQWLRLRSVVEAGGGNCHIWGEARLIAADGKETRLCDLEPAWVSVGWGSLLKNQNWQQHPLKIGDRTFQHGIWVHAASEVGYALKGGFVRFEAWAGLDADRARGKARFQADFSRPDLRERQWQKIAREFPLPCRDFRQDLSGGNAYLAWFQSVNDTVTEQAIIGKSLAALEGHGAPLRARFAELQKSRAAPEDPRWLELYARACRFRDVHLAVRTVPVRELQQFLEAEGSRLLATGSAADDPGWERLKVTATKIAEQLAGVPDIDVDGLAAAGEALASAFPSSFNRPTAGGANAAGGSLPWRQIFSQAAAGSDKAIQALSGVGAELRAARRGLLEGFDGMAEFLAAPGSAGMEREWERQFASLRRDLANRAQFQQFAPETFREASLVLTEDRDPADIVIRRTCALWEYLRKTAAGSQWDSFGEAVARLQRAARQIPMEVSEARYGLFAEACRTRRQISFANPRIDFRDILVIKRHRSVFNHMCDQYYGMAAMPGGGLCVLADAFGPAPQVRDLLAESVVANGRLAGRRLSGGPVEPREVSFDGMGNRIGEDGEGGSFLSPDLSYDGKEVAFAYVECDGDNRHRHHTDASRGHWAEGRCYHIFRVGIDGTGLRQITDGTWNDFDPCWMPSGRIAFISERRGGYLRCGRACPNYTLYDMAADGSGLRCLSFHETNEWQPSVTNEGMLIWTRWDYVDRFGCTAHHPWIIAPDGRDPRSVHGNFAPRNSRPDMELDLRAIPGSPKFVATAAPHHGQAYGSLVLVDPRVPDDDAMGPVRRITPEVGFPESQGGGQVYGTPWPLSEDFFLCVYDPDMQPEVGRQGGGYRRGDYGLYLTDSFGNRELIYRDPGIGCLSPIPVKARPAPPVVPDEVDPDPRTDPSTRAALPPPEKPAEATVAVVDVYKSLKAWPGGTKIAALRVMKVLPMTVPSGSIRPHETSLREPSARDSVVPVRYVLGTARVEADGSAFFRVPANCEVFFQALDEQGLAVQSMRSATQLHAGERLLCTGCHDRRHQTAQVVGPLPLALQRAPDQLKPDVDGSNPFSYPRLVQPVLDRHCVECHAKQPGKAPNLGREPYHRNWYASYNSLVEKYGFYNYKDPLRTTPGQFGARASKLYELLQQGHYDVKLTPEELHRIALWLDCTSMFYGVYEKERGEAQLRGEVVSTAFE